MFERYHTENGSRGSLAEVWIDRDAGMVKKLYKPNGITIRNRQPLYTDISEIESMFRNELHWSSCLRGDLVLEIYEYGELHDEPGFYLLQEWVGPDLLHYYNSRTRLDHVIKNPREQMIEMFCLFRDNNMHKMNNAMCNLVNDNGKIRAFDFKYAETRSAESRIVEIHTINTWVSKIDPVLPELLLDYV